MIDEYSRGNYREGIALVNANASDVWFQQTCPYPVCFPYRRIHFIDEYGNQQGSTTRSSCFVYLGPDPDQFFWSFTIKHQIGMVRVPYTWQRINAPISTTPVGDGSFVHELKFDVNHQRHLQPTE